MRRKFYVVYLVAMLVLLTSAALPKGRTKQAKKAKSSSSAASQVTTPSAPTATSSLVTGSGTAAKIANGTVVRSLNGLTDHVTLAGGANITITRMATP